MAAYPQHVHTHRRASKYHRRSSSRPDSFSHYHSGRGQTNLRNARSLATARIRNKRRDEEKRNAHSIRIPSEREAEAEQRRYQLEELNVCSRESREKRRTEREAFPACEEPATARTSHVSHPWYIRGHLHARHGKMFAEQFRTRGSIAPRYPIERQPRPLD